MCSEFHCSLGVPRGFGHAMASIYSNGKDLGYLYSACEESYDSSGSESENDSGCSHFYRQTAKVRFTRTTSKIQHHMETSAAVDEGKQQLFGCLRRSSSTSQMSQYLESSHAIKVNNNKIEILTLNWLIMVCSKRNLRSQLSIKYRAREQLRVSGAAQNPKKGNKN